MSPEPASEEEAGVSGKGLRLATKVGLGSVLLGSGMAIGGSAEAAFRHAALFFGLAGMALALGTAIVAIVTASRYRVETIESLALQLPLAFLLALPLNLLKPGSMWDGRRPGDELYDLLGSIVLILIPVSFFGLSHASGWARGRK